MFNHSKVRVSVSSPILPARVLEYNMESKSMVSQINTAFISSTVELKPKASVCKFVGLSAWQSQLQGQNREVMR